MAMTLHQSGDYDATGARPIGSTVTRNGRAHEVLSIEPQRNRVRVRPISGGREAWATPHQCGCFWTAPATYLIGGRR